LRERVFAAASGLLETQPALQHKKAQADIAALKSLLASSPAPDKSTGELKTQRIASALTADFDKKAYCKAIQEAQRYIAEGDIYQVNLSQRFKCSTSATPWDLYMRLRSASPAPFAGFFNAGDHQLLSSSPERFLRISGSTVETRPIKGTRPRGATTAEDQKLRQELLASAKDRAELIMIVDLERNDLGRVCRYGSIHPEELLRLEEHPVVHHLVSTIKGELAEGHDHIDCLRACFPGGSITGAPKIRAMEIIEELEPCRRKMYTGSMGYLGFNNETDLNILIRTMLHVNGTYYFNVGGGIVADSDPEMEYEETLHKGKGIMQALGIAENRWQTIDNR
jgi:para-aminobenzoate synthetase component 1